jgi:hypothetical protein
MKITDEELMAAVAVYGHNMTYVVRNILAKGERKALTTAQVLRQLKRLEAEGKVKRVKSSYVRQICWACVVSPKPDGAAILGAFRMPAVLPVAT